MKLIRVILIGVLLLSSALARSETITLLTTDTAADWFNEFLDGRNPDNIQDYSGQHAHRSVIEIVLLHQILRAGGYEGDILVVPNKWDYTQQLKAILNGRSTIIGTTFWLDDLEGERDNLLISDAIIRDGEYQTGLYTNPNNPNGAINARSLEQISALSAVSNSTWTADWNTLKAIPLKHLYDIEGWGGMIKMVTANRADFMLAPLQNSDTGEVEGSGLALAPIPNIKIVIHGSRHWAISAKHPQGRTAHKAIMRGVEIFRRQGKITQAFTEAGFFNEAASDWLILNPEPLDN